jgi:class 3 adenylate cyclase
VALLAGKAEAAKKLATEVRDQCLPAAKLPDTEGSYWLLATLGEAALILGDQAEAEDAYGRAGKVAGDRFSFVQGSRRNARLLLEHQNRDLGLLDRCLPVPRVVAFVGHMIDRPERASRRFPSWLEKDVAAALRARLKEMRAGFGFCSMACGSDILFAEAMFEMGGKVHVVIPHGEEQFVKESVDFIRDSDWKRRFDSALSRSIHITRASEHSSTREGKQYEYSNQVLQGLAMQRARFFDQTATGLAVWDGSPGDGSGGTSWTVDRWRNSGLDVSIVDLAKILREKSHEEAPEPALAPRPAPQRPAGAFTPEIRGLLFADAAGFSKLSEDQVLLFVEHFLTLVAKTVTRFQDGVLLSNTWGDGLYFVLADVRTAGLLALELCDQVAATKWEEKGLPHLNLRIGVHAGPVYDCTDPVTGRRNFIGAHVSRAARIEPVAPTGAVYSSEQFAALAAVEGVKEFRCDYVGQAKMAKEYGIFPTYVVRRRTAASLKRQDQSSAGA